VTPELSSCPRCLAPFKTTAAPTPIYTYPEGPFRERTNPMPNLALLTVFWSILAVLHYITNSWHVSSFGYVSLGLAMLGIFVGFMFSRFLTLRELNALNEKGKIEITKKKSAIILFSLIVSVIVLAVLLFKLMPPNPPNSFYLTFSFVYPLLPATFATKLIYYCKWERKNNKKILIEKNRFLAVPKIANLYVE
jgi:hypothetical protein